MGGRSETRAVAIAETVVRIRAITADQGIDPNSLAAIKSELLGLAAKTELFPVADFPLPAADDPASSCLYRLHEDSDHRNALYLNAGMTGIDTPPHNHTTWAVIVGIRGQEHNRLYHRARAGGVEQTGDFMVEATTGIAFMPDDLHSIHIHGREPVLNFHMYGLGLEQLHARQYYDAETAAWRVFPAHTDIRDARG